MADNSLKKGRYTKYSNKIGLFSNSKGSFIKNDTEVVLNFPFKDTVLEAGMSKEDKGREERFLHLEIDSKDIDTLEEPKVLTDFRYVDKDGERPLTASSDVAFFDEDGNLQQNLLIKGNNLLALYTLRERLAGKVKLIYIDPPFFFQDKKADDAFKYNSNFKLSTWLTFMKNRLEIARDFLADDGIFVAHVGVDDSSYVNILLNEIFGIENFVNHITTTTTEPTGFKSAGKNLVSTANNIFIYKKAYGDINKLYIKKGYDKAYTYYLINKDEDYTNWKYIPIKQHLANQSNRKATQITDTEVANFALNNPDKVFRTTAIIGGALAKRKETIKKSKENKGVVMRHPNDNMDNFYILNGGRITFFDNSYKVIDGENVPAQILTDVWTDISWTGIAKEGGVTLNNGKKPEKLLKRIIELTTQEGDLVMDYHLGSATTSAVAHKMNRRWVGVEQMDYINTLSEVRLKNVINGDQSGISTTVGWQGGGSFVYFELKKYNQEYIDRIMEATSLKELEDIYVEMRNNAFLKFWFDRSQFEKDEDFRQLDLDGRKEVLADVLDENQLYLNYADMDDTRHKVTADEKALTDKFYGTNEN